MQLRTRTHTIPALLAGLAGLVFLCLLLAHAAAAEPLAWIVRPARGDLGLVDLGVRRTYGAVPLRYPGRTIGVRPDGRLGHVGSGHDTMTLRLFDGRSELAPQLPESVHAIAYAEALGLTLFAIDDRIELYDTASDVRVGEIRIADVEEMVVDARRQTVYARRYDGIWAADLTQPDRYGRVTDRRAERIRMGGDQLLVASGGIVELYAVRPMQSGGSIVLALSVPFPRELIDMAVSDDGSRLYALLEAGSGVEVHDVCIAGQCPLPTNRVVLPDVDGAKQLERSRDGSELYALARNAVAVIGVPVDYVPDAGPKPAPPPTLEYLARIGVRAGGGSLEQMVIVEPLPGCAPFTTSLLGLHTGIEPIQTSDGTKQNLLSILDEAGASIASDYAQGARNAMRDFISAVLWRSSLGTSNRHRLPEADASELLCATGNVISRIPVDCQSTTSCEAF